jgi:oligoribonuclease NrnB/cAMP/cGMP phosphodiesterase (DHH superfamily)
MDLIDTENHNQQNQEELKARIKQLEEELMDTKNKHAVLVADVVLNEDRAERIKHLEREVEVLRLYGNKDCTAQADEALKEAK